MFLVSVHGYFNISIKLRAFDAHGAINSIIYIVGLCNSIVEINPVPKKSTSETNYIVRPPVLLADS